jgi:outer membrane protein assembly factor BamA
VTLRGLRRNKRSAVLAETGLLPGRPYDGTQVDEARERMLRLRVFDAVSEPELAFNPSDTTISVAFDVQEARASLFEGALAYSPNAGGSRVVGSLSLETLSLGGSLRRAKLMWLRWGNDRLSWSLYYREPRLAGRPFALEGTLASDVVDSSYARRRLALAVVYVGEPNLEIGTGGFAGTTKDRTLAGGEGNFTERGLSFRLAHEGRDRPVNPRSGMLLRFEHEVETLHYSDSSASDRTLNNLAVRAQYILGLTRQSRVALGASFTGAFSSSGAVPISHMVRLGGSGSLRGYPDDWFTAERALALSIELRRLLGMDSRIYAFFDAATLESAADSFGDFASVPFGYGVGVQSGSSAGLVRIEIALGRGDDWADAKIHVALAGLF